ncbi:hypothetical protein [Streptomyces sp. H27-H5]|uniref:hypothetical protein n=1 Tax=Streptomyces sp. H27-H5 TaxID=2996460 RepID=UPI00226F7EE6|nr:hypothetical protein [Streptomyces sp. H27-H5]MCY0960813.1 hypothetical protein [Streptomyces sp. H27-H5]
MSDAFFQPGRTYTDANGYTAPEITYYFHVEHVARHPEHGHLRATGWSKTGAMGSRWHGDSRVEGEQDGWTELPVPLIDVDPVVVRRFDCSIEPALEDEHPELMVCCVAEDGRPVALLLDMEARDKLAGLLDMGKGTGDGEPTPAAGIGDERALLLADHILNTGGTWTSGRAHRWLSEDAGIAVTARHVRRMLKSLAAYGYLTEHDKPGRVSYTPRYATGGGR